MSKISIAYVRKDESPSLPPPVTRTGPVGWLHENLFSSIGNTILTVLGVLILALILPPVIQWLFIDAVWTGDSREACIVPGAGACWAFVEAKFGQFMYGRYPLEERWRDRGGTPEAAPAEVQASSVHRITQRMNTRPITGEGVIPEVHLSNAVSA